MVEVAHAAHFGNHSCDPTMWSVGPFELVTRRSVGAGDELTVDYGTISDGAMLRMECACGAESCRRVITG